MKIGCTLVLAAALLAGPVFAQQDAFARADTTGDGALSPAEFKTFIDDLAEAGRAQAQRVKAAGRYGLAFDRIDQNRDGLVTAAEVAAMR